MKNKTKIMLGLSLLTAGTLAAGATGTFAWFTTNKTAKATYNNIIAVGTQGNIKASINGVTNKNATASQGSDVQTSTVESSYISDVSSNDGINFVQPDWIGESGNDKTASKLIDVSKKAGYFTQYNVTITNAGSDNTTGDGKVAVKLSGLTISGDYAEMLPWIRVAIIEGSFTATGTTSSTSALGVYTTTVTKDTNDKYVSGLTEDTKKLTLSDSAVKSASDLTTNPITISESLSLNGSKTIGISVWLEGTANPSASQDGCKGKSVKVALEFTSTNVD